MGFLLFLVNENNNNNSNVTSGGGRNSAGQVKVVITVRKACEAQFKEMGNVVAAQVAGKMLVDPGD